MADIVAFELPATPTRPFAVPAAGGGVPLCLVENAQLTDLALARILSARRVDQNEGLLLAASERSW
jgi:hypothetical protein